jgi:hypothetical protein
MRKKEIEKRLDVVGTDDGWRDVLNWLPAGWEQKMLELRAFVRARDVKSASDMLRITLAFAVLGRHLEGLGAWCEEKKIASCSFVALWRRLARVVPFLEWLVGALLRERVTPPVGCLVLAPLDATTFSLPGSRQRDWLVHLLWAAGEVHNVRVTKARGKGSGESLRHLDDLPSEAVVVGDRAYGTPPGVAQAVRQNRRFIARFTWNNLPLYHDREGKQRVAARTALGGSRVGEVVEFEAWVRARGEKPARVRIVAVRLSSSKAAAARKRSMQESKRKGHRPDPTTGFTAGFVSLATNVEVREASAETVADAYRWRWQVELEFKRFKGITGVRRLVNWKDEMVRCYLLALLAVWLLTHKIARSGAFFPWGYPLARDD